MKRKIKSAILEEGIISKLVFLSVACIALFVIFAPARIPEILEAGFRRISPPADCSYGYGYAYGQGYGFGYGCFIREFEDGWIHIWPNELPLLGVAGIIEAQGGNPQNAPMIQFQTGVYLHIGPHLITIQPGTIFTAPEWTDFTQLIGQLVEDATIPGSETLAALEFGLPFLNLSMNPPLQVSVYVGGVELAGPVVARGLPPPNPYEGMTVDINRRAPGASFWTAVGTCVITDGWCNFSTSVLSSFAVTNVVYITPPGGGPGGGTQLPPADGAPPPDGEVPPPAPTVPFGLGVNGEPVSTGDLIKAPDFDTVYFVDEFARRHPFLGLQVYAAWYGEGTGFEQVIVVDVPTLAAFFPLGAPVVYPPGSMIKTPDNPMVYLTIGDRRIKHILDETVAEAIFGPGWATMVYDISPFEMANYIILAGSITDASMVDLDILRAWTDTINTEVRGTAVLEY